MTQQDPPKDGADPAGIPADFPEAYSSDSVPRGFSESKLHFGRETVIVAVIILLALALRVLFIYQVQTSEVDGLRALKPGTDMLTYDNIARWVIKTAGMRRARTCRRSIRTSFCRSRTSSPPAASSGRRYSRHW